MDTARMKRLQKLEQSEIRNMSLECDKVNGINLSQGMCDLPLPDILKNSVNEALDMGFNHYTRYDGIDYLRMQISRKAQQYNHIKCDPNKNIIVSAGATGALIDICYALFQPGDEIILFEPYYGYHEYTLMMLDLCPVYATLQAPSWDINPDEVEKLITEKTKAILISTPCNPCGKIFTTKELSFLGELCKKYNLYLISDEIYEYITFDQKKHISPASIKGMEDITITISGYSKTFSITGWRIGYVIANEKIAALAGNVNDLIYVCAPAPLQYAVAKAMEYIPESFYERNRKDYEEKRDILCRTLEQLGMHPFIPEGAYYVLADLSVIPGRTSKQKALYLLQKTGVAVVPGKAFFREDNSMARFCFAKDKDTIMEACQRLENI